MRAPIPDVEPVEHETRDRVITAIVTVLPVVALAVACWQAWAHLLRWSDLIVFAVMYVFTGLGVTVGFHRHLTHRSFRTSKGLRAILAILGSAAIGGSVIAGLTGLLWGGGVRMLVVHHVTYSINSLCHYFGSRRFATDDRSYNLMWLAPFSFGESWHNNHHAFPTSAIHGLRRWELDVAGLVITGLEKLGLVWDVVRIEPARIERKALAESA